MNYVPETLFESLATDGELLTQWINGYIGYLKRSKQGQSGPGADHSGHEGPASYDLDLFAPLTSE
ncbi:MAG: hypothetical protein ACM3QS_07120 [Bacteroidota bacterium]